MERVGRLSRNTAALVGARVVTSGLTFILAIIINRNLGPEKAGIYTYAFSLYTIFQVIPDFGIGNISIRDASQDNSRLPRYFANIASLRLLLGLAAFGLLMITNFVTLALQGGGGLAGEKFWVVFTVAFCLLIEQPLSNSLCENFIALERLGTVALVYLVMGVMKVGMSIYVVFADLPGVLVYLVLIYIVTIVYSVFHLYIAYRRVLQREDLAMAGIEGMALAEVVTHIPEASGEAALEALLADCSYAGLAEGEETGPRSDEGSGAVSAGVSAPPAEEPGAVFRLGPFTMDGPLWRYLLASAWPLAVVAAGVTVYAGIDIPILSWLRGDREVGLYGAAGMFAKAFVFLTLALNMAVLPAVSKVGGKHPERLGKLWERLAHYALLLVVPLMVVVPVLARPVLVLQKHEFIQAWHATWLTMAAMCFTLMTAVSFPFFIVIDRQKTVTAVVLIGLPFKAAVGALAISLWGYTGAALAVLLSEAVVFLLIAQRLTRALDHRVRLPGFAAPPALILGALYAAAFFLHRLLVAGRDTFMVATQYALISAVALTVLYAALALGGRALTRSGLRELNEWLTV